MTGLVSVPGERPSDAHPRRHPPLLRLKPRSPSRPGTRGAAGDSAPRIEALSACVSALHQLFGTPQVLIDIARREAKDANARFAAAKLDVVVCTTRGQHLLSRLPLGGDAFRHQPTDAEPLLLGFRMPRRTL